VTRVDPLLRELERAVRALDLPGRGVLAAVSGGIDSTVLAHGLAALAPRLDLRMAIGHVHHGLRGAAADADRDFVEALASKLGLPFHERRVDPHGLRAGRPSQSRPTLQEAARRLRHEALAALAREAGAERVATAHQLDDQAETVLLRVLRGCGPTGLGGIPERSPDGLVVRPLLGLPRAEIERFARARHLSWREDASNRDPAFARARLRRDWLGALGESFNPRWLRAVGDLAEAMRRESEWIEGRVGEAASHRLTQEEGAVVLDCRGWSELPEALARRLVRRAWHACGAGRDLSRRHLEQTLHLVRGGRGGARLELPGGLVAERRKGLVRFRRAATGQPQAGC
jgi:tRNA(Ile)-lysidine synthase